MSNLKERSKKIQYYIWNTFFCKRMLLYFIVFFVQTMFFSVKVFANNLNNSESRPMQIITDESLKYSASDVNRNKTPPMPIVTDERFRRFVYSSNEVFPLTFQAGIRTVIEFQKDEMIEMIIFGDATPWKFSAIGRKLTIKPIMPNVRTNMTVYTDKRRYIFEISSVDGYDSDEPVAYIVDFFYPDINVDIPPPATKLAKIALNKKANVNNTTIKRLPRANNNVVADAGKINTSYTYSAKGNVKYILPTMVFDDGEKTYFKFNNSEVIPTISVLNDDYKEEPLLARRSGEYVYIETTAKRLTLRNDRSLVCIFNEKKIKKTEIAYMNK